MFYKFKKIMLILIIFIFAIILFIDISSYANYFVKDEDIKTIQGTTSSIFSVLIALLFIMFVYKKNKHKRF